MNQKPQLLGRVEVSLVRVLELYDFDGLSGVSRVVHELAHGLRVRGHDVVRMLASTTALDDSPVVEPLCCDAGFRQMPALSRAIRRAVLQHRVDVVHAHHRRLAVASKLGLVRTGIRVVEHAHSVFDDKRLTSFRADLTICLSDTLEATLHSRYKHTVARTAVCHNGVPVPDSPPEFPGFESIGLISVGRVEPAKRPDKFVRLLRGLKDRGLPVAGVWLGDGPLLGEYRRSSGDVSSWPGAVPDVRRWLGDAHCVVSMSDREGVPFALLDGMALGRAILAVAVGGVGDLVDRSVGRLWSHTYDFAHVIDEACEFLSDTTELRKAGSAARARVEEDWSSGAMVERCEGLLLDQARMNRHG